MNVKRTLAMAGAAALVCWGTQSALAQAGGGGGGGGGGGFGGGNFDPAAFQQRMMEGIRDRMAITNDEEWRVVEQRVQKVLEARREMGPPGGFGRMFGRGRGGDNGGPGGGRRGAMFGTPMPEMEALTDAVENKAPADQIKAALEKYRAARKAKEAALEKAQEDLKAVLTVKQEAAAVTLGLLN